MHANDNTSKNKLPLGRFPFPGETPGLGRVQFLEAAILEMDSAESFTEVCRCMVKLKIIAAEIRLRG